MGVLVITKEAYDELVNENERLRQQNAEFLKALHEIWGWYPISITQPRKTIDDMREYAKTAIAKATGGE